MDSGVIVKAIRKHFNLSQEVFADKMGLSRSNLSQMEIGRNKPDIYLLNDIAKNFNINVACFLSLLDKDETLLPELLPILLPSEKKTVPNMVPNSVPNPKNYTENQIPPSVVSESEIVYRKIPHDATAIFYERILDERQHTIEALNELVATQKQTIDVLLNHTQQINRDKTA